MKILRDTFDSILACVPKAPPETGGILGGRNQIVSCCVFDRGSNASNGYDIYAPDTQLLNQAVRQWEEGGIEFYGIFHSHFSNGTLLSNGDRKYITKIMLAMPPQIDHLYFPVVIPKKTMMIYRAERQNDLVYISNEQMEIL